MEGSLKKNTYEGNRISGSSNSSSSSSSFNGGGEYGSVSRQAAEATTTTPRSYGKRTVFEVADGGNDSTSHGPNRKKSRAIVNDDAATSVTFSRSRRPEVPPNAVREEQAWEKRKEADVFSSSGSSSGGGTINWLRRRRQ